MLAPLAESHNASWRHYVALAFLATSLAYSVFQYGGVVPATWNVSLLIVGVVAVIYWQSDSPGRVPPSSAPWRWALMLFPAYVALQTLPLPLFVLRIVSPARAGVLASLGYLMKPVHWGTISVTPETTFLYLFRVIGYTLTFLLVLNIAGRMSGHRPWAPVIPLIGIAGIEAAWGLLQNTREAPVQGSYVTKNTFAGLLEMVLPLALAYGIALVDGIRSSRASGSLRVMKTGVVWAIAILILTGLLYSMSKMGVVAGLGGLFAMGALAAITRLRTWKRWLAVGGIAALLLFVFVFIAPESLVGRFGGLVAEGQPAGEGRWPIWIDTLHLIAAYPLFGSGLGTYETAFLKYQTSVVDRVFTFAHNDYLELAAELGAAGLLILAAALPICARAFRAAEHGRDRNTCYLGMGCAGAITAIALHSLTDFNWYIPANAMLLAWILGISAGLPMRSEPAAPPYFRRMALALGCLLVIYAPAWILFERVFRSDLRAESLSCRFGICDTGAVVTAETIAHGGEIAAVPPAELLDALRRDAHAPDRWCDAGEALARSGDFAEARYCFAHAIALGPHNPPVLMRAADFYYGAREDLRALAQLSHILAKTDSYDGMIFDWYSARNLPVDGILSHGLAPDRRSAQSYLHYWIINTNIANAKENIPNVIKVWDWTAAHGYADDRLARGYLDFLVSNHRYETAALSWASYLANRRDGYLQSTWIYNGGFESEPGGSALDWRIDNRPDVEVARDAGVAHTGGHSLRIRFAGKENLNYSQIAQTAFVRPGVYCFEAYLRTHEITTDQGVGFHIFDPEASSRLDVKTERVLGTNDWKRVQQTVSVPPQTRVIEIQVVRSPSLRFDSDISGTVWIDNVRLCRLDSKGIL